jgi:hypothetical protein
MLESNWQAFADVVGGSGVSAVAISGCVPLIVDLCTERVAVAQATTLPLCVIYQIVWHACFLLQSKHGQRYKRLVSGQKA